MHRLGQPVVNVEIGARRIEGVVAEDNPFRPHHLYVCVRLAVAGWVSEVRVIVRQNNLDRVRNGVNEVSEEVCCDPVRRLAVKLNEGELRRRVNGNEEIEVARGCLHFGNVDMEEAD